MNCYALSHCESLPILRVGNRARAQAASREFMSGGGRRSHPSVDPYPTLAPRPPSAPNTEGPNWTGVEGTARGGGGGGRADHLNHLVGSRSESEELRGKLAALAFYPLAPFLPSYRRHCCRRFSAYFPLAFLFPRLRHPIDRTIALSKVLFESELPHFFAHSVDGPSDTEKGLHLKPFIK